VPTLRWNDNFNVGVEQFDLDHRHLFELLKSCYDNLTSVPPVGDFGCSLDAFIDYATDHFNEEEKWMKANNYPKFAEHLNLHDRFMTKIIEIRFDCIEGRNSLSVGILDFVKYWLTNHVWAADTSYGRFAASNSNHLRRRSYADREPSVHPTAYACQSQHAPRGSVHCG